MRVVTSVRHLHSDWRAGAILTPLSEQGAFHFMSGTQPYGLTINLGIGSNLGSPFLPGTSINKTDQVRSFFGEEQRPSSCEEPSRGYAATTLIHHQTEERPYVGEEPGCTSRM